jgi:pimeloyl-ACP methyl ester carboxylesterase
MSELPHRPVVRAGTVRTADGALLAWQAHGQGGGTPLICSNGVGVSTFFWKALRERFARERCVVIWDYRGHGQSPVPPHPEQLTVRLCASDLWQVADAVGVQRAVLVGHSMGCQVMLEAHRQAPGRSAALLPMLGASGAALQSFLGIGDKIAPLLRALLAMGARKPLWAQSALRASLHTPLVWPAVKALGVVHPDLCPRSEFVPYFEHLERLDLRVWFALAQDLMTHDASDVLPGLRVPMLVVAGERDLFTPLRRSEEMAAAVPGAELLVLRGGSHAALVEQPELINQAVERFLQRHGL